LILSISIAPTPAAAKAAAAAGSFFGKVHVVIDHKVIGFVIESDLRVNQRIATAQLRAGRRTSLESTDESQDYAQDEKSFSIFHLPVPIIPYLRCCLRDGVPIT
jgi:hypothetical protein